MRWPLTKNYSPIGLDLGAHSFKAVQLKLRGGRWEVASSVSLPRSAPDAAVTSAEIDRVRGVLERRGFVGRDVIVAVPTANLLTSVLELPARAPGLPLEQIALAEFSRSNKVDAAAMTMATWDLPPSARASKATYMLAVGAKSADLETHIDLIESAGLRVAAIEEPHTAAVRGVRHLHGAAVGLSAVIDLGWHAATLVVAKDDIIIYTRKLADAGLRDLCRDVEKSVEAEDATAAIWRNGFDTNKSNDVVDREVFDLLSGSVSEMLKEIGQALSYTSHQYPDAAWSNICLVGGGAAIPCIAEQCSSALDIPAIAASGDVEKLPNALESALGLALSGEVRR